MRHHTARAREPLSPVLLYRRTSEAVSSASVPTPKEMCRKDVKAFRVWQRHLSFYKKTPTCSGRESPTHGFSALTTSWKPECLKSQWTNMICSCFPEPRTCKSILPFRPEPIMVGVGGGRLLAFKEVILWTLPSSLSRSSFPALLTVSSSWWSPTCKPYREKTYCCLLLSVLQN